MRWLSMTRVIAIACVVLCVLPAGLAVGAEATDVPELRVCTGSDSRTWRFCRKDYHCCILRVRDSGPWPWTGRIAGPRSGTTAIRRAWNTSLIGRSCVAK